MKSEVVEKKNKFEVTEREREKEQMAKFHNT